MQASKTIILALLLSIIRFTDLVILDLNRREFSTTEDELRPIASAARIGRIENIEKDAEMTHIERDGVSIYLQPEIYRAIDAGRQDNVRLLSSRGKLVVKGFSLLM